MKLVKQNVKVGKELFMRGEKAVIEGVLSLPEGMDEIDGVLAAEGRAEVRDCVAQDGRATLTGSAKYAVVYIDKKGDVCSFESECSFEHVAENGELSVGMDIFTDIWVGETDFSARDSRSIEIRSALNIELRALGNNEFMVATGVTGSDSTELLKEAAQISSVSSVKSTKSYVKADVRIPHGMPEASRVLFTRACASVDAVHTEEARLSVEGEIKLYIVYLSDDEVLPIQYIVETKPFAEIVKDSGCTEESHVCAYARVCDAVAEAEDESFRVHIVVDIKTVCYKSEKLYCINDLYSANSNCAVEQTACSVLNARVFSAQRRAIRLPCSLPSHEPELSRAFFACGCAVLDEPRLVREVCLLSGTLIVTLCYMTSERGVDSVKLRMPFELEISSAAGMDGANVLVEDVTVSGAGRELELKASFGITPMCLSRSYQHFVTNVSEGEAIPARKSGVTVWFPDGESLWEVGKRFHVAQNQLLRINPSLPAEGALPKDGRVIIVTA